MVEDELRDGMQRRRITLKDGRYMIFYTFEDEPPRAAVREAPPAGPHAENEAEDNRGV